MTRPAPPDPMAGDGWDVIVIGAGMGGSVTALALAQRGLSVLVMEAGARTDAQAPSPPSAMRRALRRLGLAPRSPDDYPDRWPEPMLLAPEGRQPRPVPTSLGRGPGGSSTIYGAALERLRRTDFERDVSDGEADALPTVWPFDYDVLRPWYARAEALMGVVGGADPLDPDDDATLAAPPPLCPRDAAIAAGLSARGLHPFRAHVGMEYRPGCAECLGRRCPRGCKADGENRALAPALATGRAALASGFAARRIDRTADGVAVVGRGRDGVERVWRARAAVAAGGALKTPLLLARSHGLWRDGPPTMLGRGLMFHVSDMFLVFDASGSEAFGPMKTLAMRDFYERDGARYGEIQSMGIRLGVGNVHSQMKARAAIAGFGWLGLGLEALRPAASVAAHLMREGVMFATIQEDLPDARNRVWEAPDPASTGGAAWATGRIAVRYRASAALRERARRMRGFVRGAFAPNRVIFLTALATPNWGHPLGTCRMGSDPATSASDADGRVRGCDQVWVVDGSALPTSGGANPSLTIAANALRVASGIADALSPGAVRSA